MSFLLDKDDGSPINSATCYWSSPLEYMLEEDSKWQRYTEEQIIQVLKEGEAGATLADLCRRHGMSEASYYNWKAKYTGEFAATNRGF